MLWAACPVASPGGPGTGKETEGCGEVSRCGQEGPPRSPPAPLARCSWWGRYRSCSSSLSPRQIRASPQMPQRGQVSARACPQEARPCPRLSLAWFSLVCFLCHTVQSLGFEGGKGGLCFINPISLVIQITLPKSEPGAHKALTQTRSDPLAWQKLRAGSRGVQEGVKSVKLFCLVGWGPDSF